MSRAPLNRRSGPVFFHLGFLRQVEYCRWSVRGSTGMPQPPGSRTCYVNLRNVTWTAPGGGSLASEAATQPFNSTAAISHQALFDFRLHARSRKRAAPRRGNNGAHVAPWPETRYVNLRAILCRQDVTSTVPGGGPLALEPATQPFDRTAAALGPALFHVRPRARSRKPAVPGRGEQQGSRSPLARDALRQPASHLKSPGRHLDCARRRLSGVGAGHAAVQPHRSHLASGAF